MIINEKQQRIEERQEEIKYLEEEIKYLRRRNEENSRYYAPRIQELFQRVGEKLGVDFDVLKTKNFLSENYPINALYFLPDTADRAVHLFADSAQIGVTNPQKFKVLGRIMDTTYVHRLTEEEKRDGLLLKLHGKDGLVLRCPEEKRKSLNSSSYTCNGLSYFGFTYPLAATTIRYIPDLYEEENKLWSGGVKEGKIIAMNDTTLVDIISREVPELRGKKSR